MAAELYVKEVQHSPLHGTPTVVIEEGDFVTISSGGEVALADPANGDDVDGIVPTRQRGDVLREHEEDYGPKEYDPADGDDFVPFYQLVEGAELTQHALTAAEAVDMYDGVALDSNLDAVPASSADAETGELGTALTQADVGDGVAVRIGL